MMGIGILVLKRIKVDLIGFRRDRREAVSLIQPKSKTRTHRVILMSAHVM